MNNVDDQTQDESQMSNRAEAVASLVCSHARDGQGFVDVEVDAEAILEQAPLHAKGRLIAELQAFVKIKALEALISELEQSYLHQFFSGRLDKIKKLSFSHTRILEEWGSSFERDYGRFLRSRFPRLFSKMKYYMFGDDFERWKSEHNPLVKVLLAPFLSFYLIERTALAIPGVLDAAVYGYSFFELDKSLDRKGLMKSAVQISPMDLTDLQKLGEVTDSMGMLFDADVFLDFLRSYSRLSLFNAYHPEWVLYPDLPRMNECVSDYATTAGDWGRVDHREQERIDCDLLTIGSIADCLERLTGGQNNTEDPVVALDGVAPDPDRDLLTEQIVEAAAAAAVEEPA